MAIATVQKLGNELADLEIVAITEPDVTWWHDTAMFTDSWDGEILSAITEVCADGSTRYQYMIRDSVAGLCRVDVQVS